MLKNLKKKLILSYFERKKIKEPFDEEASECFELSEADDIHINNSHFFTASDARTGETLSIRLGMRNNSDYEIFVLYKKGNLFLVHEKDSYAPQDCPVKFTKVETGKIWRVEFNGRLRNPDEGELVDASIELTFTADYPIYDFVYHADQFNGMAESIAREKWNKAFFAELGRNNQRHYEQDGSIRGTITIAGESSVINLHAVRDHSFGRREWDMMNDHIWLLAVTEEGKVLSYSIVNYPKMKRIFSGYTNILSGRMETLRDYEMLCYDAANGLGGDILKFKCTFPGGKVLDVEAKRTANVRCVFGEGCYSFQESFADFRINGMKATGTLEYGFNKLPMRWEGFSRI